jgi:hypothetical protein
MKQIHFVQSSWSASWYVNLMALSCQVPSIYTYHPLSWRLFDLVTDCKRKRSFALGHMLKELFVSSHSVADNQITSNHYPNWSKGWICPEYWWKALAFQRPRLEDFRGKSEREAKTFDVLPAVCWIQLFMAIKAKVSMESAIADFAVAIIS